MGTLAILSLAIAIFSLVIAIVALVLALALNTAANDTLQQVRSVVSLLPGAWDTERVLEDMQRTQSRRGMVQRGGKSGAHVAWELPGSELGRGEYYRHRMAVQLRKLGNLFLDPLSKVEIAHTVQELWEVCVGGHDGGSRLAELLKDGWEPFACGHDGVVWVRRPRLAPVPEESQPDSSSHLPKNRTLENARRFTVAGQLAFPSLASAYLFLGFASTDQWYWLVVAVPLGVLAFLALCSMQWPKLLSWLRRGTWTEAAINTLLWTAVVWGIVGQALSAVGSTQSPFPGQIEVILGSLLAFALIYVVLTFVVFRRLPVGRSAQVLTLGAVVVGVVTADLAWTGRVPIDLAVVLFVVGLVAMVIGAVRIRKYERANMERG